MFEFRKAKSYCREPVLMIENSWEAASDQEYIWNLVHRLEDQYTPEELRSMKKWYNRPASELIFCKGERVDEEYTDN